MCRIFSSGTGSTPELRSQDDFVLAGDDIARGTQAVAVEGGADLPAVGEGDGGRTVPRLHQGGMIFVEGAALLIHERVARPGFGDEQHHGVGERIAALDQQLHGVVEAGGVRLAFGDQRPEAVEVLAEHRRLHGRLPGRHPVEVAAQGVDFAVVADHPEGMGQTPAREGVGRKALMHQGQGRGEARIVEVVVIVAELGGEQHALVADRAARHGRNIECLEADGPLAHDLEFDHPAHDEQFALEGVLVRRLARDGR